MWLVLELLHEESVAVSWDRAPGQVLVDVGIFAGLVWTGLGVEKRDGVGVPFAEVVELTGAVVEAFFADSWNGHGHAFGWALCGCWTLWMQCLVLALCEGGGVATKLSPGLLRSRLGGDGLRPKSTPGRLFLLGRLLVRCASRRIYT